MTEVGFDGGSPPPRRLSEQQLGMTAYGRSGHQAPRIPRPVRSQSRRREPGRPRVSRRALASRVAADSAPGKTRPARERDRRGLQQPPRCDPQLRILCLGGTRRPIRTRFARSPGVGAPRPRADHARRRTGGERHVPAARLRPRRRAPSAGPRPGPCRHRRPGKAPPDPRRARRAGHDPRRRPVAGPGRPGPAGPPRGDHGRRRRLRSEADMRSRPRRAPGGRSRPNRRCPTRARPGRLRSVCRTAWPARTHWRR